MFCTNCKSELDVGIRFCTNCGVEVVKNTDQTSNKTNQTPSVVENKLSSVNALVRRGFLLLEDGDYDKANELLDKALNEEPENALAYLGLLCVELRVSNEQELANYKEPIAEYNNFKKAVGFGDISLVERLNGYNSAILDRLNMESKENYYQLIINELEKANWLPDLTEVQCTYKSKTLAQLAEKFKELGNYKEAVVYVERCEKAVIELKGLAAQHMEESLIAKALKKKKRKKGFLLTIGIIGVITVGIIGFKAYDNYYKSLPGKYYVKYNEALADADFDTAMELYKKYLNYYDHDEWGLVTDVRVLDENSRELKDKDDVIAYSIKDFSERCEYMRMANEAFEYICNGDYEKGNELFINNWTSLSWVSKNRFIEKFPEFLNGLNAVEVLGYGSNLYWLNEDGTVGRIGGNYLVDDWKDIVDIRVYGGYDIAGLNKDGTVIFNEYTIENVVDFIVGAGYLVGLLPDGTLTWQGNTHPPIQSGFDDVKNWSDVKSIEYFDERVVSTSIIDPDGVFWSEYSNAKFDFLSVPCLVVTTNDGRVLVSAYNIKITYPSADQVAKNIVSSIDDGWDKVIDYLNGNSLSIGSGGIRPNVELVPLTIDDYPQKETKTVQINNVVFKQDSDSKWKVEDDY